jgi:hypothetical protein
LPKGSTMMNSTMIALAKFSAKVTASIIESPLLWILI